MRPAYCITCLLVLILSSTPAVLAEDRPNVLFISIDDLKPAIGAFGDEFAITPHMDRLAGMGTAFTNAHCQQAICAPSRVSIMLGLRPDTTKVWDLHTKFRDHLPDAVSLPERFKHAGYTAVGMGKVYDFRSVDAWQTMDAASWSEPYMFAQPPAGRTLGFRNPDTLAHIQAVREANPDLPRVRSVQSKAIFPNGPPVSDCADVPDNAYVDGATTDLAIQQLDRFAGSGEPFFLAIGYNKPHLPFNAPERYWRLYDRDTLPMPTFTDPPKDAPPWALQPGRELRRGYDVPSKQGTDPLPIELQRELVHGYYACVSYIDAQVGRLLDALEANEQLDNTVIVLWGDHGWHLGDHGMWCKHTNYEQSTRSPLIIAAPGQAAGEITKAPVELLDIYPTLLDLAGLKAEGELHGTSLHPILDAADAAVKPVAMSQYHSHGNNQQFMGYAFRDERYRLVQWRRMRVKQGDTTGPVVATELYDYQVDPLETRNLANDPAYADVRRQLELVAEASAGQSQ
ncbi:MAG: sulfatase [Planctomycetota bacterium]